MRNKIIFMFFIIFMRHYFWILGSCLCSITSRWRFISPRSDLNTDANVIGSSLLAMGSWACPLLSLTTLHYDWACVSCFMPSDRFNNALIFFAFPLSPGSRGNSMIASSYFATTMDSFPLRSIKPKGKWYLSTKCSHCVKSFTKMLHHTIMWMVFFFLHACVT